uniref:Cellular tumor antigen p53 n=1 Tax=Ciona intestinalis TaxID=7719 RepID=F6SSG7_CIOIN
MAVADTSELNFPDSQESFSDFWMNTLSENNELPSWQTDLNQEYDQCKETVDVLQLDTTKANDIEFPVSEFLTSSQASQQSIGDLFAQSLPSTQCGGNSQVTTVSKHEYPDSGYVMTLPNNSVLAELQTSSLQTEVSLLPNNEYPGIYNFEINFGEKTESAPKSAPFTYSYSLQKLFVKMNENCPIKFRCSPQPPSGCVIRAIPVFEKPNNVTEIVTRCFNHRNECRTESSDSNTPNSHLIRVESKSNNIQYCLTHEGRECVVVPYEPPHSGSEYMALLYRFMCLSSCRTETGINRRPLLTIFNLESETGELLGKRVVSTRICACPGRDRTQEEEKKNVTSQNKSRKRLCKSATNSKSIPVVQKNEENKVDNDDDGDVVYTLNIRGKRKFEKVKEYKEALDLLDYVQPDVKKACCQRNQI